jgi:hypothetical protein
MKHVIDAGTDVAMLAAFDAAALPADFDQRVDVDGFELMQTLETQGRMWFGHTGGDGGYVVHVIVDEEPAGVEHLQPAWQGTISLPGGRLWVCGAEFVANDPAKGSASTPAGGLESYAMGSRVDLTPGVYDLQVFEVDNSDAPAPGAGATAVRWLQIVPFVPLVLGGLSVLFSGVLLFNLLVTVLRQVIGSPVADGGWHVLPVSLGILVAGVVLIAVGLALGRRIDRMPAVVSERARREAARLASPDFIFALRKTDDAAETDPA